MSDTASGSDILTRGSLKKVQAPETTNGQKNGGVGRFRRFSGCWPGEAITGRAGQGVKTGLWQSQ